MSRSAYDAHASETRALGSNCDLVRMRSLNGAGMQGALTAQTSGLEYEEAADGSWAAHPLLKSAKTAR